MFVIFLVFIFVSAGPSENKGAPDISIGAESKGQVAFPHKTHQDTLKECDTCHSLFPKEPNSIQKLIGEGKLQKKQVMNHCRDCHKEKTAAGEKAGPTSCATCHPK